METPRLMLRLWTGDDAAVLWQLNEDPEVLRYTGDTNFDSVAAMRNFLLAYDQFEKYRMGRLVVELKATGEVLGWCGLKYHADEDFVDLGYRFFQKYWNQGYATEASEACLKYGFQTLRLQRIVARAAVANEPSIRVMQKLGMAFYREAMLENQPSVEYEITAEMWATRRRK